MMKLFLAATAVCAASVTLAVGFDGGTLTVTADRMAADNKTGTLVATGHVRAVTSPIGRADKSGARPAPVSLLAELVEKDGDEYRFAGPTAITTCTNDAHALHWQASGNVVYKEHGYVEATDMTLYAFGIPVMWFPYWYQPLDTNYGWRVTPGYTSRWGAYLLSKFVYGIYGSFAPGEIGLYGASRLDLRSKNGIAVGQSLHWQLGDVGKGLFKVYYAWDQNADTYDKHWSTGRNWRYSNWGSEVPDERYGLMLEHRWQGERDVVRLQGAYYSDSYFQRDFLREGLFGSSNRFVDQYGNELAWERAENSFGAGVSVSGPLNDFYGGTSRLPEFYFDVAPQPVFALPVNYESATRIGYLNRNYAKRGDSQTDTVYRYDPGEWADFQAFRADTYHRLAAPLRCADVVSVVPRIGFRATYWSETGYDNVDGYGRALEAGDAGRTIFEFGTTFSARGTGRLGDSWLHTLEPYLDVLAQEAHYEGLADGSRPYVFDSVDASRDWLDQFAGRSRNLPYSWYGITPGLRNVFKKSADDGSTRTMLDLDLYASVQFNDTSWTGGGRYHRLASDPAEPNYGRRAGTVVPGMRARWFVDEDASLSARIEYDCQDDALAYADIAWRQQVEKNLSYYVTYASRDHRAWDFSSAPHNPAVVRNEDFNWAKFGFFEIGVEHEFCDALAWGPFVRWDCREGEVDEVGSWFDIRTDCLGLRFSLSYENDYSRIDGSRADDDWRFGVYVYLRALGPGSGSAF